MGYFETEQAASDNLVFVYIREDKRQNSVSYPHITDAKFWAYNSVCIIQMLITGTSSRTEILRLLLMSLFNQFRMDYSLPKMNLSILSRKFPFHNSLQ